MPGIAGIISKKPAAQAIKELARMVASMCHEPFYVTGTWTDESLGMYVGWVVRGDGMAAMPQSNERGDKVLVFAGEDYAQPGSVAALRGRGHEVGTGRGAHLVHMAEEDAAFPAGLNGQFHGLLIDRTRATATLFNDRHASRRVYYHQAKDGFYFAAEAKALLAVRPELRALDERGLGEFVACGCVLEDRTLFKGIRILPWAAAWVFRGGMQISEARYFSSSTWEQQGPLGPLAFYEELRDVFGRNLARYCDDGHVALSLTGGLDTRMIMAWRKPEPQSLPCYTFGGAYRESRDVRIARRVATLCRQAHQVIPVDAEFLSRFPHYAERTVYLTDGATGVEQAADLYVNEIARQIAPVRLTGNYGDEVLKNRIAFRPSAPGNGVFQPEFDGHIAAGAQTYADVFRGDSLTHVANRQVSWFFYGLAALELTQVEMRSPFLDDDLVRTLYRAPADPLPGDVRVRMIRDANPVLGRIRTDLGYAGRGGRVAEAASRFWNRATMRAEYACEMGDPRWVPAMDRRLLGRTLEKTFVGIHKFTHFSRWYREELADYVRAMLFDARTLSRPYLRAREVEAMVDRHVSGEANCIPAIHKILTLELIHRLWIDAP